MGRRPPRATLAARAAVALLVGWMLTPIASAQGSDEPIDVREVSTPDRRALAAIVGDAKSALDYVVDKVAQHDAVFLGETHMVAQNCRFVADALGPLYHRAGLRTLASEFVRQRNTEAANRLVRGAEFDEALALRIVRDGPWPTWGFRDYVDILRAVWAVNAKLRPEAPPLDVVGMDSDWDQHRRFFGGLTRAQSFRSNLHREKTMIRAVRGAIEAGKKTLVHVGFAHSVTTHGERLATVLTRDYGERLFQICLHQPFGPPREPAALTALIESLCAKRDGAVGFDVIGTPFGRLVDRKTMFARVRPNAGLADWAHGYVFLAPVSDFRTMTWIPGFIDEAIAPRALAVAKKLGWVPGDAELGATALDAALAARFDGGRITPR